MKTIAYIFGYRWTCDDDCRLLNLKITIDWILALKSKLKEHNINLVIIIVEQHVIPKFHIEHCVFKQLEYIFLYNDGYYNRGWGFNVGFKKYVADYYFFADGDIIMNQHDMIHVFKTCFKYDAVNPYEDIYDSTKEYIKSTGKLELIDLNSSFKGIFPKRENTCFSGGIMGICKSSMNLINGWDERFRGRGWEDYAFTTKIKLFIYSTHTYVYSALHLWHPWEINTTKLINQQLNLEYEKYNFYDYYNLINTYVDFGSPLKYAISTSIKPCKPNKKDISDDRYYFAKDFFDKLFKKYKNTKDVYLRLCDQLKQIHHGDQIQESGGLPDDEQDKESCHLSHEHPIHHEQTDDDSDVLSVICVVGEINEIVDLPHDDHLKESVDVPPDVEELKEPGDVPEVEELKEPVDVPDVEEVKEPVEVEELKEPVDVPEVEELKEPVDVPEVEELKEPVDVPEVEELKEPVDVPEVEELKEPVDVPPEVEELKEPVDVPEVEELKEPVDVPEVEELKEPVDVPDVEELKEPVEVEEIKEPVDVPPEVEEIKEPVDVPQVEEIKEPVDVEELKEPPEVEELKEPVEVEEIKENLELPEVEELKEPVDVPDVEEIKESTNVDELKDGSDLSDDEQHTQGSDSDVPDVEEVEISGDLPDDDDQTHEDGGESSEGVHGCQSHSSAFVRIKNTITNVKINIDIN